MRWRQMGPADDRPSRADDVVLIRQIQASRRKFAAALKCGDKAEVNRCNIVVAEVQVMGREAWAAGRDALGVKFMALPKER